MISPLERPPKKQRLDSPSHPFPLSLSSSLPPHPATADKTIDDIEVARAQNESRLKSAFEHIFEKYGRDFSDVGDEIDLQTGGIIIDNGHIEAMTAEGDTGEAGGVEKLSADTRGSAALGLESGREESDYEEAYALSELGTPEPSVVKRGNTPRYEPTGAAGEGDDSDADDGSSIDSLFDVEPDSFRQGAGTDTDKAMTTTKANSASEWPAGSLFIDKDKDTNGVDSTWTVPDTAKALSTPTWNKPHFHSTPSSNAVRSASPLGAGSLWSLPRGRGRPSGSGMGKYKKRADSTLNRKPRPTPVTQHWSSGDTSDGSESDDPLQEDHQTLPTPTPVTNIRGKRLKSPAQSQDQSPCPDYIPRLKISTPTKPEDGLHIMNVTRNGDADPKSAPVAHAELHEVNTPGPKPNEDSLAACRNSTPTKTRRPRALMTPNEAKLVMKLRQVEKRRWDDIANYFPGKNHLRQWSCSHYSKLQKDPPRLSRPWSHEELVKLDLFKDLDGLTWAAIWSEFPGRQHAELEFALLRLWAGDEACHNNQFPGTSMSTNGQPATG